MWSNKLRFKDKNLQHTHDCFLRVSSIQWVAPHKKLNILSSWWWFSSPLTKRYVVVLNCVRSMEQCSFQGFAKTFRTNHAQRNEHSRTSKKKEQKQGAIVTLLSIVPFLQWIRHCPDTLSSPTMQSQSVSQSVPNKFSPPHRFCHQNPSRKTQIWKSIAWGIPEKNTNSTKQTPTSKHETAKLFACVLGLPNREKNRPLELAGDRWSVVRCPVLRNWVVGASEGRSSKDGLFFPLPLYTCVATRERQTHTVKAVPFCQSKPAPTSAPWMDGRMVG
jgi:hypothetical protein